MRVVVVIMILYRNGRGIKKICSKALERTFLIL